MFVLVHVCLAWDIRLYHGGERHSTAVGGNGRNGLGVSCQINKGVAGDGDEASLVHTIPLFPTLKRSPFLTCGFYFMLSILLKV